MARPPTLTVAAMILAVTSSVVRACIGALLRCTAITLVVGGTVASSVEATSVRLIASTVTSRNTAVDSSESRVTLAVLVVCVTDTIAGAIVGAHLHLGFALQTNKAGLA